MAASQQSICNTALRRLKADPIANIDEGSTEANACKDLFDGCVEATLSAHPWNFATYRRTLADTGSTIAPWAYGYSFPTGCLTVQKIWNPLSQTQKIDFEVAINSDGRKVIYTDKAEAVAIYTGRVTDFSLCHPLFIEAVEWKLQSELALAIPRDYDAMQIALNMYRNALAQAETADANEGVEEDVSLAPWTENRLGVGSSVTLEFD